MSATNLLPIVDSGDFHELFIRNLFWNNPDRPQPLTVTVDGVTFTLAQVAGFKGLRVWVCDQAPSAKVQRAIDLEVGKDSAEHLVIFCGPDYQDWRWPRRAQTGGVNAKLMMHRHMIGQNDQHLDQQLQAIKIDLSRDTTLVELLSRMRAVFDAESETESAKAARLMGTLYSDLEACGLNDHDATLLLARLLFLLFGDDTNMWGAGLADLFINFVDRHTTDDNLNQGLLEVFRFAETATDLKGRRPGVADDHPLARLPYINGGLFSEPLDLPPLTHGFRQALIEAGAFDWSLISPAIFGSMFQTVKNREARRAMGEHYTTETNILRTLRPLFLDELEDRLERSWDDKGQLTKLLNDLAAIRVLDPACGCGNFLVVAYRELRAIELQALVRRRDLDFADGKITIGGRGNLTQTALDATQYVGVTIDHFYGIEIEEWPARIAETAMLLVDHLANQRMEEEFGMAPHRLPIKLAPTIVHGNALRIDWARIVPPTSHLMIAGNPPFLGHATRTPSQAAELRDVWNRDDIGRLDYVTGWYAKALQVFRKDGYQGRFAFVSTNSITQGEPVPALFGPIFEEGWRIRFAHQTFPWVSEAPGAAAVHCVVLGFDRQPAGSPATLYEYPDGVCPIPVEVAKRINGYLIDGPNVLVQERRGSLGPLAPNLPPAVYGNMARDGGGTPGQRGMGLIIEPTDYEAVMADAIAAQYVRPFIGAEELLHGNPRWCLWMVGASPLDIERSSVLTARIKYVREFRARSSAASTQQMAQTPHLFGQRSQPTTPYLAIPAHSSETRIFFPVMRFEPNVICGNANFETPDPDGLAFAVISSSMFIAWLRGIGGTLESRLRFSNTLVWNTFPLPSLSERNRMQLIAAGQAINNARSLRPERSLAQHYDPVAMSSELLDAHAVLDVVMDRVMGAKNGCANNEERLNLLFKLHAKMTGQEEDPTLF